MTETLRINEVFFSLQGEARTVGLPTVFVRLTGCPLRCGYCDSEYAFYEGERKSFSQLLDEVAMHAPRYVCVTGGEPLAQPGVLGFLALLCDRQYQVSLETSGAMPIESVDPRVSIVMDLKTPGSGEVHRNRYENIAHLSAKDQVKFVITNRDDFEWAVFKVGEYSLTERVGEVLFSPSYHELDTKSLAEWILTENVPVRMQIQLHKVIWGDVPGV